MDRVVNPPQPRPWQFTLRSAALAVLALAVGLALVTQLGRLGWVLLYTLVSLGLTAWTWHRSASVLVTVGAIMVAFMLAVVCLPVIMPPPGDYRRRSCQSNLRNISIALQLYHDDFGSFPPAYIADAAGRPMHSWRVLLLPYLERKDLYEQYDFAEPWDGPNNRKLMTATPRVFRCPSNDPLRPPEANYLAVLGPQTMWPTDQGRKLAEIADGAANTLQLVEVHGSGIHWMEPRDLHVSQMPLVVNPPRGQGVSCLHPNGANVVFADGHTEFLRSDTPPEVFRALLTIDGQEPVRGY